MNWRFIEDGDYNMLCQWWESHGWEQPPTKDMLPTGILVYDEEEHTPLYAGFLYNTNTSLGWIEYVVSNPSRDVLEKKRGALSYLVETISTIAKCQGIKSLFTSTIDMAFVNSLKKNGFQIGDVNTIQMIKTL